MFGFFSSLAEYERELIKERTIAGIESAKARGRMGGRPRAMTPEQVDQAKQMLAAGMSRVKIAKAMGIARPTLIAYLKEGRVP
jgi:DNA invertase Pin-like site-specific DNA recombinase